MDDSIPWPAIAAAALMIISMVYLVCSVILAGRGKKLQNRTED
jgi:hypothetical protein